MKHVKEELEYIKPKHQSVNYKTLQKNESVIE